MISNFLFFFSDSVLSGGGLSSGLGLSSIKLESPAYYCTSYTPPCSDSSLISSNYGSLSLARSHSPSSVAVSLADNSVIRVKRMRRMSSEHEEDLRGDKVSDLYYSQSPLGQTQAWSQAELDQGTIGRPDIIDIIDIVIRIIRTVLALLLDTLCSKYFDAFKYCLNISTLVHRSPIYYQLVENIFCL